MILSALGRDLHHILAVSCIMVRNPGFLDAEYNLYLLLELGLCWIQVLALQVTARYCNFFGAILDYSILVLDDAQDVVSVDVVKPTEIYMHFPPGSRVNIKWKPPVQVSTAWQHASWFAFPSFLAVAASLHSANTAWPGCENQADLGLGVYKSLFGRVWFY